MAEKLVIELELENVKSGGAFKGIARQAQKAGEKSGSAFSKAFKKDLSSSFKSIGSAASKALLAASALGGLTFAASVRAANQQEDAIKRLNTALDISGDFTEAASQDIQKFASELQSVTRFGDEVILNQVALAKSFGATNEQAKEIAKTAADVSEAFGIDIESATRNVAKTLGGFAGELGETIPELKTLGTEALQAGKGIELLSARFGGTAQKQVGTFSGALAQAGNSFGDLLERIGEVATKSPVIIDLINKISESLIRAQKPVLDFAKTFDFFDDLVRPIISITRVIIDFLVPAFEVGGNAIAVALLGIINVVEQVKSSVGTLASGIASGFEAVGLTEKAEEFKAFASAVQSSSEQASSAYNMALDDITNTPVTDSLQNQLTEYETFFQQLGAKQAEANETISASSQQAITDAAATQSETISLLGINLTKTTELTGAALKQQQKQVASIVKNGLVNSISSGVQSFTKALSNGENAFEAFGQAALGVFGDLAIQLGQFFIAQGIAVEALNAVSGTGAIAAGVALVALGTLIKGATGGGSAPSNGSSGASAQFQADNATFNNESEPEDRERAEQQSQFVVNVQGDIFDTDATGTRLAEIFSEAGAKQGILVTDTKFA